MEIFLGITLGLIIGVITSFIAYKQQLPKWQVQGFSRAKTSQDKEVVKNYYDDPVYKKALNSPIIRYLFFSAVVFAVFIPFLNINFLGINLNLFLFTGSIVFLITFLTGFISSAFISDKKIRSSEKPPLIE